MFVGFDAMETNLVRFNKTSQTEVTLLTYYHELYLLEHYLTNFNNITVSFKKVIIQICFSKLR